MKGVLVFLIFGPVGWLFYYFYFVRRRGGRLPGGLSGAGSIEHGRDFPVAPLPATSSLVGLERQIMEQMGQGGGFLSASALAEKLGVPEEGVRKTIKDLAERKLILLE